MSNGSEPINYLSTEDILAIHGLIVESNDETEPGIASPGDIDYTVEHVREGHFGHVPESVHETAFQLLRLIAANHPFVDGNKRTALMSVRVFYSLNGLKFDYDREIKEILKRIATDESAVDPDTVLSYLRKNTCPLEPEYDATIHLWLSQIENRGNKPADAEGDDPNDYDQHPPSEE